MTSVYGLKNEAWLKKSALLPWIFYFQFPKATCPSHSWMHRDLALPMRGILVPLRGLSLPFETEMHHTAARESVE